MHKTHRRFDTDHEDNDFLGAVKIMGLIAVASFIVILMSITMILIIDKLNPVYSPEDNNSTVSELEFGIVQIKNGISPEIIYDKNTRVMYIRSDNGFITPLLDSDGNAKKYEIGE